MPRLEHYFSVFFAAALWGFAAPVVKYLGIQPVVYTSIRLAVPALLSLGVLLYRKENLRSLIVSHPRTWIASVLNVIRMYLYIAAVLLTSVGNAVVVCYTSPLFSTLFGMLYLREKPSPRIKLALFLGFLGVVFVYAPHLSLKDDQFLGLSLMLGSAVIYAMSNVLVKRELHSISEMQMVFMQNALGLVIFPVVCAFLPLPAPQTFAAAAVYSVMIGFVAFGLYYRGLRALPVAVAVAITYLEVAVAIVLGMVMFNEPLTINLVIGCVLVMAASFLAKVQVANSAE